MQSVLEFSLRQRVLMVVLLLAALGLGFAAFQRLNIEAYPDPVPPMVDVITQSAGLSAEEVERYITIPIETQVAGLPNLNVIRTISLYGLSDVKLQFTFAYTYEEALQQVLNRLAQVSGLPDGVQPQISPTSPIGEIYRYKLSGPPGYSVLDLKTLQDWVLQRRFRSVPGVIDVTGWGGKTKRFELQVDLNKLVAFGLTFPQVLQALTNSNINVGGDTLDLGAQTAVIRGVALIHDIDDIKNTMITQSGGNAVRVSDIANVLVGFKPRLGIAGMNEDDDIVQGIVLMRRGEKSSPAIARVEAEVEQINSSNVLPPGVKLERIYDRKDLIGTTTNTVLHNMVMGILLIFIFQWLFLGDLRSAIIVASTIPFALSCAIGIMVLRGESANLLSVGAIDFGLIVDATVVMVEGIFSALGRRTASPAVHGGLPGKLGVILGAGTAVGKSIFFAAAIILAGFIPLFSLGGVEGQIFGPMAKTYAYALLGGLVATFTIAPALSAVLLPERVRETETWIVRRLHHLYTRTLIHAVSNRGFTLLGMAIVMLAAMVCVRTLGLEFLPKLEEGNLWIRATLPPTISLTEGNEYVNRMRGTIGGFAEVETVVSQHGRPDDGTDAAGFFNAEFFVPLKPVSKWPSGMNKEQLTSTMQKKLEAQFPGVEFNFSQYLEDNVAEAVSGVKGENSIKVFGSDLHVLTETAAKIKSVLQTVPGVTDLGVLNSLGQPTIQIEIDRTRAARYGLAPGDVNATIKAALAGASAGDLYENGSDRHFPIVVRLAPQFRQNAQSIGNLLVGTQTPNGIAQIPLSELATIKLVSGPSYIYREQQQRYLPIKFSVRDRDLGNAILEAQTKVAEQVQLPAGTRLEWVGEFKNLQEAVGRLKIVVPVTLAIIGVLLWVHFSSVRDTLLAMSVIPMAVLGGIFALSISGISFSVSAAIGFVALFGISAMDGIIILSQYNNLIAAGLDRTTAVLRAGELQMRPVLMTCVIAGVGLVPAALSTGIGSQVQKPLAVVVVGGMTLAPLVILIVLPVLIATFSRRKIESFV